MKVRRTLHASEDTRPEARSELPDSLINPQSSFCLFISCVYGTATHACHDIAAQMPQEHLSN